MVVTIGLAEALFAEAVCQAAVVVATDLGHTIDAPGVGTMVEAAVAREDLAGAMVLELRPVVPARLFKVAA